MSANYTIELRTIHESDNMKVFDFDYDFYDDDMKSVFEEAFINHYYFNEIGFETIARFKQRLKSKLNLKYRYYKQLYETELKAKEMNFLLNKDLKETFTREITKESNQEVNSNNDYTSNTNVDNESKESNIDNGNATLSFNDLTSISKDNTNSSTVDKSKSVNTSSGNDREVETNTSISQGNIGITSTAELLEKWRNVIININEIIIEDCYDLFMLVY